MLSPQEVAKHNSRTSCWVIVSGSVYDITEYIDSHPGGANVILRHAGKDATAVYEPIHPAGTIERTLPKDKHLGPIHVSNLPTPVEKTEGEKNEAAQAPTTPIQLLQNLDDFESVARKALSRKAWIYFDSGADSLHSVKTNRADWEKITFRPRILRSVAQVTMRQCVMGHQSNLPFFIAPAAMAKLGHADGELCLARGAARSNIPYCVSTYSSVDHRDLATCLENEKSGGALIFQLYVAKKIEDTKNLIAKARSLGYRGLVVTVDTAVVGKREEDERYKAEMDYQSGIQELPRVLDPDPNKEKPILRGAHSSTLTWDDLAWIRRDWGNSGPVIIKGIQTAEDARRASDLGVDGIYLSNHGGRQLDFAPSSIRTLLEIRRFHPEVLKRTKIYLDGGVRRGTDILKALCLGATAVGLGRPFLYALSGYGTDGVMKAIQILGEEIETAMRLMGVVDLQQLSELYVNTSILEQELPRSIWMPDEVEKSRL